MTDTETIVSWIIFDKKKGEWVGTRQSPEQRMIRWMFFDNKKGEWMDCKENAAGKIESEYQMHSDGTRAGHQVYHCFGDGGSALINFETMQTECGSGKCTCGRPNKLQHALPDDHMTFALRRVE